ncbi:nuclear transport factor 2 family protein [Flavobacterium sp.]|uniref:nuclear transport factor 2 family protein n=1 Tax=Flavobacterium sp. TaxID=239 RepID=UPI0025F0402F|nr:nuclear transport factor 2 family protein [Flavobacterium sp.]
MNKLFCISLFVFAVAVSTVNAQDLNPYHLILKGKIRKSFDLVNQHQYDELLKGVSDKTLEHSFAGDHSLGGKRHDKESLKRWFIRLGIVLPDLKIEITDIQVKGNIFKTIAIVRWTATCTLLNGESYVNKGVHFITLKLGKAVKFDVFEDTKTVSHGLDVQFESGIKEAKAPKIES